jgi:hypothetical protein
MYLITKEQILEMERIFRSLSHVHMWYQDKQQLSKGLTILGEVQKKSLSGFDLSPANPKNVEKKE